MLSNSKQRLPKITRGKTSWVLDGKETAGCCKQTYSFTASVRSGKLSWPGARLGCRRSCCSGPSVVAIAPVLCTFVSCLPLLYGHPAATIVGVFFLEQMRPVLHLQGAIFIGFYLGCWEGLSQLSDALKTKVDSVSLIAIVTSVCI